MKIKALEEMAGYLERGEFGGRGFNMGCYAECVLGHAIGRELERAGVGATVEAIGEKAPGASLRIFGIRQSVDVEEWGFAFGARWGGDPKAAARRLRYLAVHGGAPDRSVWDLYRSATDEAAAAQYGERCEWSGATWNNGEDRDAVEEREIEESDLVEH